MTVYVLRKFDIEKDTDRMELYVDKNDAFKEMWNKINFQTKIRRGVLVTELDEFCVDLSVQDEIGGPLRTILSYSIEEHKLHLPK